MSAMGKVAVVTGGSSGIGAATASRLLMSGCTVYEFSRRNSPPAGVRHVSCDIADEEQVARAVAQVLQAEGRIDILVNCAGYGISGAAEFTDTAEAQRQLNVNLFGTARVTRAVLPHMREQGGGRIVNVSSVAACVPIPFQAWYSVSKAAVNSYTMALANEVRPFGITVCAVMPGDTSTGFTSARCKEQAGDDVYGGMISRSVRRMEKDELSGASAQKVGKYICRVALRRRIRPLYTVGFSYKLVVWLMRVLPSGLANRLIGMIYAR